MSLEKKKFHIVAVNSAEIQISMSIVERDGSLWLLNGLDQRKLSLPADWKWEDMESEVKRASGVIRMAMCNA